MHLPSFPRLRRTAARLLGLLGLLASALSAQTLYVSMNGSGSVKTVTSTGTVNSPSFATGVTAPKGLTFDSSGNLYVVENINGTLTSVITRITPDGTKSTYATGLQRPIDLAFDTGGNLFVTDYVGNGHTSNAIMKVAPGGGAASTFVSGSQLNSPYGLAINSSGTLFVSNVGDGSISQIATNGTVSTFLAASTFNQPNDLTFDSSGNLFVASFGNGAISKVTGTTVSSFGTVSNAVGLAINPVTGSIMVASQGGSSVYEIGVAGGGSTQFAYFGGDSPQYLAYSPSAIPEPSTYAALAGAAMLALAVWRRRRRSPAPVTSDHAPHA